MAGNGCRGPLRAYNQGTYTRMGGAGVAYLNIYLNDEELAYVRWHDPGFVRKTVQASMRNYAKHQERERLAEEQKRYREERHETFVDPA